MQTISGAESGSGTLVSEVTLAIKIFDALLPSAQSTMTTTARFLRTARQERFANSTFGFWKRVVETGVWAERYDRKRSGKELWDTRSSAFELSVVSKSDAGKRIP